MLRIITKSFLRIITSLLHHYNIIITSFLHRYYNIIALLLRSLLLHYYYVLLFYYYINHYYVSLQLYYYILLRHYYIIITLLLRYYYVIITKRKSCNNDGIITCYANGMPPLLHYYYALLRHYYVDLCYYPLLLISVSQTCRWGKEQMRNLHEMYILDSQEKTDPKDTNRFLLSLGKLRSFWVVPPLLFSSMKPLIWTLGQWSYIFRFIIAHILSGLQKLTF